MFTYQINHFAVESDIPLPCDPHAGVAPESPRTPLRIGYAPEALAEFPQVQYMGRRFEGTIRTYDVGTGVLLCVGEDLRMHVACSGRQITIDCPPHLIKQAGLYVIGAAMAFCIVLQGGLPLHASGVDLDGKRIGFLAPSGTGKSTTMWALLSHGAKFVSDDLIPVFFTMDERPDASAVASVSLYPKAGRDMLERDGIDYRRLEEASERDGKYWYPIAQRQRAVSSEPLTALFLLRPSSSHRAGSNIPLPVEVRRIPGALAIPLLVENTHAMITGSLFVDNADLLTRYLRLVQMVPIYTLHYEKRFDALPYLIQALRASLGLTVAHVLPTPTVPRLPALALV